MCFRPAVAGGEAGHADRGEGQREPRGRRGQADQGADPDGHAPAPEHARGGQGGSLEGEEGRAFARGKRVAGDPSQPSAGFLEAGALRPGPQSQGKHSAVHCARADQRGRGLQRQRLGGGVAHDAHRALGHA
eukprot:1237162-Alexandrium_andersonii.AAC.1